jgi:hypothetical protein
MATFKRPTRPADRNLGYVAGEQLRPRREGGFTFVQASGPQAKRLLTKDGWGPVEEPSPAIPEFFTGGPVEAPVVDCTCSTLPRDIAEKVTEPAPVTTGLTVDLAGKVLMQPKSGKTQRIRR